MAHTVYAGFGASDVTSDSRSKKALPGDDNVLKAIRDYHQRCRLSYELTKRSENSGKTLIEYGKLVALSELGRYLSGGELDLDISE